jgi:hypothetical protein
MKLNLLFILFLAGCATGVTTVKRTNRTYHPCEVKTISKRVDSEILPFVEEFVTDAKKYDSSCNAVRDIFISNKVTGQVAGYCIPGFVVVMSNTFWDRASTVSKRTLVYHELGHCALDREHVDEDNTDSIMNPYVLSDYLVEGRWEQLVERLFNEP